MCEGEGESASAGQRSRAKRRIIAAAMPTRYVGLFCHDKHFNIVRTYAIAHVYAPTVAHWLVDGQAQYGCEQCGQDVFVPTGRRIKASQMVGTLGIRTNLQSRHTPNTRSSSLS